MCVGDVFGNSYLSAQGNALRLTTAAKCLDASCLLLNNSGGAVDENRSVGRSENFLNGSDSSTFEVCCNGSFTQLLIVNDELHQWW
jgi:hypothetical protein